MIHENSLKDGESPRKSTPTQKLYRLSGRVLNIPEFQRTQASFYIASFREKILEAHGIYMNLVDVHKQDGIFPPLTSFK
jgi:hypothetical protein